MIHSFACSETERLFKSQVVARFKNIERVARRKLQMLNAATKLESLKVPPGNRLALGYCAIKNGLGEVIFPGVEGW